MKSVEDVVKSGLCIGCGICTYSADIDKTIYSKRSGQFVPLVTKENRREKQGFSVCPGKGYNIIEDSEKLYNDATYDVELGHIYNKYASFSNDYEILKEASSGGVMTALAIYLLGNNLVDRVLVTKFKYEGEPRSVCILAKSREDILQAQGSKYCPVDTSAAIKEIKHNNYRVAVIGTPCQIAGIRSIQRIDPKFNSKIIITIANFCGGVKSYNNINLLAKRKGIDPEKIKFFRFRGNGQPGSMLMEETSGKTIEHPYPKYVGLNGLPKHLRCHLCVDATGELADIACGDAWLPRFINDINPWSIIVTRNKKADDLVRQMSRLKLITTTGISINEIKHSQKQNLVSKKVRQKGRFLFYRILGFTIPRFDGGYHNNKFNLWTELKVFSKHKCKHLLEGLHLFQIIFKLVKK